MHSFNPPLGPDRISAGATGDLTAFVERWIDRRTGGRVRSLSVERVGDRLMVHGFTGSHYVRQLVLAAVLEALESSQVNQAFRVDIDIQVGTVRSRSE